MLVTLCLLAMLMSERCILSGLLTYVEKYTLLSCTYLFFRVCQLVFSSALVFTSSPSIDNI